MTDRSDNDITHHGDRRHATTAVAASANAEAGRYYSVDTTTGNVTMTLPTLASSEDGASFLFYKTVAANSMIIDGNGAETIEGSANVTVTAQYSVVSIRKADSIWQLVKATTNPDGISGAQLADDSVDSEHYVDGSIDSAHIADDQIDSQHYAAGSIDNEHLAANSVDSDQYVDGSIDPEHFAAAAVVGATLGGGTRANTADTAVVLDAADALTVVTISSTAGAGTRTITRGTLPVGAPVAIVMTAFDTNAYTAAVQGGTVTFNAVGEAGLFFYDGTALRFIATGDVPATFA